MYPLKNFGSKYLSFFILLGLVPYFSLFLFSHPSADDYCFAAQIKQLGMSDFYINSFFQWSGRYFIFLIKMLHPLAFDSLWLYRLYTSLSILLVAFSIYVATRLFIKTAKESFLLSASVLLAWFNLMPSPAETIYWLPGNINYTLPFALLILLFVGLYKQHQDNKNSSINIFLSYLYCLLLPGTNEPFIVYTSLLLAYFSFLYYKTRQSIPLHLKLCILFFIVGSVVSIFAPGNFSRMELFQNTWDWGNSFLFAIADIAKVTILVFANPLFWFGVILILFTEVADNFIKSFNFPYFKIAILLMLAAIFLSYVMHHLLTGLNPPLRYHNANIFIIMLSLFLSTIGLKQRFKLSKFKKVYIVFLFPLFLIIGFSLDRLANTEFGSNTYRAWNDLLTKAYKYDDFLHKRHNFIQYCKSNNLLTIELATIPDIPNTIHFIDISEDSNHWINNCFKEFYGLETVSLRKKEQ